jgi:hypothetical protein
MTGILKYRPLSLIGEKMSNLETFRILCPGKIHKDREKILAAVRMQGNRTKDIAVYCQGCNQWSRLKISPNGAVKLTRLPKKYHLSLNSIPVLVVDHGD